MDDSNKSVTAGPRGELALIGAQRHTSLTYPVASPARILIPMLLLLIAACSDLITLPTVDESSAVQFAQTDAPARTPDQPVNSCLPALRSFSARAVTPRLNRLTWRLPRQITGCPYTGLEIDVWTWDANGFVQLSDTATVFLHGMEDTCVGLSCQPLTDADSVVAYKMRTISTDSAAHHLPGAWSRQITVRRNTSIAPTVPLGLTVIHNGGGYADLSWSPPNVPVDTAGVTYDVQRRPGRSSWRSLPSVDGAVATRRISFADLPLVGVQSKQTFRVRSVHNGRRSAWVESDGNLTTWDAPKPFWLNFAGIHGNGSTRYIQLNATARAGTHTIADFSYTCEISAGNRSNYAPNPAAFRDCGYVPSGTRAQLMRLWVRELAVDVTYWVRVTAHRGTLIGASEEIDFTIAADSTASTTQTSEGSGPPTPPPPTSCGTGNFDNCERPNAPDAVATWGSGSVTVSFNINYPNYNPGTNPNRSPARVTRVEMKYRACPYAWRGNGWVKVGEHGGEENDSCRHGTRNRNGSSGSLTFRGSFSADIDMWNTKVEGRVRNSRGRYSTWAGGGGHVTP